MSLFHRSTRVSLSRQDTGRNIVWLGIGLPPDWSQWHPSVGPVDAARLAGERATNPQAVAFLAEGIRTVDRHVRRAVGIFDVVGVWAPDPSEGKIAGWLVSEIVGDAGGESAAEKHFERNRTAPKVPGRRYFGYHARIAGEAEAGTAVLVTRNYADRGAAKVEDAEFTIFPHDGDEAVRLTFTFMDRTFADPILHTAGIVARNVQLTLGHLQLAGTAQS